MLFGQIITHDVGRFVLEACPRRSFEVTKTYGQEASSASRGMWVRMSIGEISAAMMTKLSKTTIVHCQQPYKDSSACIRTTTSFEADTHPFSPFFRALTTSLTPRLTCRARAAVAAKADDALDMGR